MLEQGATMTRTQDAPHAGEEQVIEITPMPVKLTRLAEKIIESLSTDNRESVFAYVAARQEAIRVGDDVSEIDHAHPSPSFRWALGAVSATMANERPFLLIASFVCLNANFIAGLVYLIRKFIA